MSCELKQPKTFAEQLGILEERDLLIDNSDEAIRWLQQVNYYRLTGYSFHFLKGNNKYKKTASFEIVSKLYLFDSKLRRILMMFLEPIEIYAHTQIAYWFTHKHGAGAHYDAANFDNAVFHREFVETMNHQIECNERSAFVAHHIRKYDGKMPLWCAVEILSLSTLSKLYKNMHYGDKKKIADELGLDPSYIENWLHCFSVLRNACAHYGRLYNTSMTPEAMLGGKTLRRYPSIRRDSLFAYVVAILRFLPRDEQRNELREAMTDLLHDYVDYVELGRLGFPEDWEKILYDSALVDLGKR